MFFIIALVIFANVEVNGLVLKQVVILSRHNIRAPLTDNLEELSENIWPKWKTEAAHLTPKGALLEGYMGEFFLNWLQEEKLFNESCPSSVHIYANAPQRTRATAEAFVNSVFKNCSIKVNYKENVTSDPVFHPVFQNDIAAFKEMVILDMQKSLDELELNDSYQLINNIIDIETSKLCKIKSFCDMTKRKDDIIFEINEEPNVYGPLSLGNTIVDVFLMSLYQGHNIEDIAWGKIRSPAEWKTLTRITKENQNVRFKNPSFCGHLAKPLLDYMKNLFLNDTAPKLTGLFGHDSNLNAVMCSLGFKPYELPRQYEGTPIGGKIVFQKWHSNVTGNDLLKIDYVYPSVGQLRFSTKFWDEESPQQVTMELEKCKIDKHGFCSWSDFVKILHSLDVNVLSTTTRLISDEA
ncbi:glucose-1-phosphatase-like [Amyelois transitella]|uniref:glucose-1-phosphatase-like n=1 Tax=Amyelois transitella TaxID=680683 RepID=UPI00298F72B8|nr:glucose-1-phosphatase-like [Amyelois transitella]